MGQHHGDRMNTPEPLTVEDLQIPCEYGVYEYRAPFCGVVPVRLLWRGVEDSGSKTFVMIKAWDRTEHFHSIEDEEMPKLIFKIPTETLKDTQ